MTSRVFVGRSSQLGVLIKALSFRHWGKFHLEKLFYSQKLTAPHSESVHHSQFATLLKDLNWFYNSVLYNFFRITYLTVSLYLPSYYLICHGKYSLLRTCRKIIHTLLNLLLIFISLFKFSCVSFELQLHHFQSVDDQISMAKNEFQI